MANFKSVDFIVTAKHYGGSARGYIRKQQQLLHSGRGIAVTIKDLDKDPTGVPVVARIWQGQWIADCECNGASFVDPDEPVFFCFSCGNRANGSKPRPVTFPPEEQRLEIERLLLERPVDDLAGLTDLERAGMAKPILFVEVEEAVEPSAMHSTPSAVGDQLPEETKRPGTVRTVPLVRSWEPHETVDDLRAQQEEPIRKWHQELREGNRGVQ
jgi:hypothetical protein